MSLSLEWGAVAGVAPTHAVAIGFKYGTRGFDMQQKNNQAREQTEASLYAELVKLAPFLQDAQLCIDSASDGFG